MSLLLYGERVSLLLYGWAGRAWRFHGGKQRLRSQGLLKVGLSWASSLPPCPGTSALAVWQCLTALAPGFGLSACREWGWLIA